MALQPPSGQLAAAAASAPRSAPTPSHQSFPSFPSIPSIPLHPHERLNETNIGHIPEILPHERMFPIQIGTELFQLSGASLSSDAPSYFSQYFRCQLEKAKAQGEDLATAVRPLCIDRDPVTFRDIVLHLQGYHIAPRTSTHFVRLVADAQFYHLPKLISQLFDDPTVISVGGREFELSRSLFTNPGNSPNYFTLGFGFFQPTNHTFPGLDRDCLMRPPSIQPPALPNRSGDIFAELVHFLRGYPIEIRSEEHRKALLRDCRYFSFKGLEQQLIPHLRGYNQERGKDEIVMRLDDVLKSGLSVVIDSTTPSPGPAAVQTSTPSPSATPGGAGRPEPTPSGWVHYARPYVDSAPAELIFQTDNESVRLHFDGDGVIRAEFFLDTRSRFTRLLAVVCSKLSLASTVQPLGLLVPSGGAGGQPPTPGHTPVCEDDRVRVVMTSEIDINLDGKPFSWENQALEVVTAGSANDVGGEGWSRKRRRTGAGASLAPAEVPPTRHNLAGEAWIVKSGQWRVRINGSQIGRRPLECLLFAVKIDALSSEVSKNASRGFLGT